MRDPDTVATLFDMAISLETIAQTLYHKLAERFSHVPEASRFWKAMETDEIWHARELESIRNSLSPDELLVKADLSMLRSATQLMRFSVEDALKSIMTLEDAYQLAHELEYSEVNRIFEFLASEFISSEARLRFVKAAIENHLNRLMELPETFGDATRRTSVVAKAA